MTTPTTPSDDLEAAAKVAAEGPGPLTLLADREWQDLCEKDDRTSPADSPEMCLIARNELGGIISEGFLLAKDQGAAAHRALEAKVVELVAERLADKARIVGAEGELEAALDVAASYRRKARSAEAALRASQEALGKAVEGLKKIEFGRLVTKEDRHTEVEDWPPGEASEIARQTLAQVEGGGEDKGSIPGTRPDDLRASRGEGSGS